MPNKNSSFKININFLDNKKIIIRKAELYINIDENDEWALIDSNSIMAYEKTVIKIRDLDNNKEIFLFLINANIIVINSEIIVNTFSKETIYKKSKKSIDNKTEINKLSEKVKYYNSLQTIGLSLNQYIEHNSLKQRLYIEILKQNLKLVGENYYETQK